MFRTIATLPPALELFLENGRFPSETDVSWAVAGGKAKAAQITQLDSIVDTLTQST